MEFISNNNKGLIWGLLQESNIFDGIENENFARIQTIFEDTISSVHRSNTNLSLLEKNKLTMNTLIKKINDEKSKPKKSIQMVYRAEDIQNKREQEFNVKLKEQQDNLNKMINPSKPKAMSFSDETGNEDKPIGDDMDRLIAERLATRERELEIPQITKETEQWLNNNREVKLKIENKSVSFNESVTNIPKPLDREDRGDRHRNIEPVVDNMAENMVENRVSNSNSNSNSNIIVTENKVENSIFNKLKRKQDVQPIQVQSQSQSTGLNIEQELHTLRENQNKLMDMCTQILDILQNMKSN
jgi:hypothetical protein